MFVKCNLKLLESLSRVKIGTKFLHKRSDIIDIRTKKPIATSKASLLETLGLQSHKVVKLKLHVLLQYNKVYYRKTTSITPYAHEYTINLHLHA